MQKLDLCQCGAKKKRISQSCWKCYARNARSFRSNHHLQLHRLTPLQRVLFDFLCKRPLSEDTAFIDIERDAYYVAINSKDPIEDLKLFGPPVPRPISVGCGLTNFRPHRGRQKGIVLA